ncbi:hypothetical protein SALBM311S_12341 [Streptomyces alboniger]
MTSDRLLDDRPLTPLRTMANKVPEVTAYFWIIKVLTTGMGETASDLLAKLLGPVPAVGLGGLALAASLAVQFAVRRYIAWVYWTAVVMVSVFGTMAADVLHVGLGVPYAVSTPLFFVALAAAFTLWYAVERTLSIHSITTRSRELFYWAAVLATFALGTAAGDLTATAGFGYLGSVVLFAVAICVPALVHRFDALAAVPAFWTGIRHHPPPRRIPRRLDGTRALPGRPRVRPRPVHARLDGRHRLLRRLPGGLPQGHVLRQVGAGE